MVYGVVMYDFQAERADELDGKGCEAIIVIAQFNPEWFVAKPIGRLGGPGLIPVTFVEIRDMASNTPVANPKMPCAEPASPKSKSGRRWLQTIRTPASRSENLRSVVLRSSRSSQTWSV